MRKWGYGVAGLLVLAFFAGIANPDQAPDQDAPTAAQSQTQTSEPTQSPATQEPTEAATEEADAVTSEPSPEPSPEPSETTTQVQTETQTSEPRVTQEAQQPAAAPTPTPTPTPAPTPTPTPTPTSTQAVAAPAPAASGFAALLAQLEIEDEFQGGYDRDLFSDWIDADRNGCDTRREVLIIEAVVKPVVGERCAFTGGSWYSPFDGVTTEDASVFDIDHMVPLKEAWDSGAHAWDSDRRRAFANDLDLPEALIAVSRSSNRSKSDRDPADWLPPLRSYHCQYVRDWMVVKIKWELSVDPREFTALRNVAAGC